MFSPNVATYVGDGEAVISWLLTGGVASGVLVFLGLSLWLLICSVQKARRRIPKPQNSTEPLNNGNLLDDSKLTSRSASLEAVVEDAATFEEQQLRQTTALARAQRTKGRIFLENDRYLRSVPDLNLLRVIQIARKYKFCQKFRP